MVDVKLMFASNKLQMLDCLFAPDLLPSKWQMGHLAHNLSNFSCSVANLPLIAPKPSDT